MFFESNFRNFLRTTHRDHDSKKSLQTENQRKIRPFGLEENRSGGYSEYSEGAEDVEGE